MKTIDCNVTSELVIKNSRFITKLILIDNQDISSYLQDVKEEYPKATHYTYAYIYNDIKHFSDDGEPGGTAGMPMLNVLEKECLNNILCIVIRYFGGIKLGAGGLVRAYTKSVTEALKNARFVELIPGYKISLQFNYDNEKDILYILNGSKIVSKEYLEKVNYVCLVDEDTLGKLSSYDVKIINNCFIKKDFI